MWARRLAPIAPWAAGALIVLAPHLIAGAFAWTIPVISAAALLCLALALTQSRIEQYPVPTVVWAAVIATLWTALQLVPLGSTLIGAIDADRAAPVRLLAAALGALPATATAISYDPGATKLELMKGFALLGAFIASDSLARRGHARLLLIAAAGSGALMALVALGHRAANAQTVWGLYRWQHVSPRLPAPILNDNCLAGFMALTAPVALGLAMSTKDIRERVAHYLAAFVIAGTGLLTGSRAGTGAVVFGLVSIVVVMRLRNRRASASTPPVDLGLAGLVVGAAIAIAVVVGSTPLFDALLSPDLTKLELIRDGFSLAWHHLLTGVGRGAFSAALAPTMLDAGRFVHAENFAVTWCSEWGMPVALLLLWTVGTCVLRAASVRDPLPLGTTVGLLAFASQNLLDLSMELVGIAVVATAMLGAVAGETSRDSAPGTRPPRVGLRQLSYGVLAGGSLAVALLAPVAFADGDDAFIQRLEAHRAAQTRPAFRAELARALRAHPMEPVIYFAAGREAVDHRDPTALRWLNLAMLRAPLWSAPHVEAARLLVALGRPGQAALEAREAGAISPRAGARAACLAATGTPAPARMMKAAEGAVGRGHGQRFFDTLLRCLDADWARAVDRHLIAERVGIRGPLLREYQRLMAEQNSAAARRMLEDAVRRDDADAGVLLTYARLLLSAGDTDGARRHLGRARQRDGDPDLVLRLAAEVAAAQGDVGAMRSAIDALRRLAASSGRKLARASLLLATLEERLGNHAEARAALDDAVLVDPTPATHRIAIDSALRRGDAARALRLRASLCAHAPQEASCSANRR